MSIWISVLVLFGLPALAGFFFGAIQASFVLGAALLGLFFALPLGTAIKPIFTLCGLTNPVWLLIIPPIVAYLLMLLVAWIAGFLVHRKIWMHHKHISDDFYLHRLQRVNSHLGLCLGILIGFFLLLGSFAGIYGIGYLSTQLASPDKDPAWLSFINRARTEMHTAGFDRLVHPLDPMPPSYYTISDVLGLLYQNYPAIHKHVAEYPPFFTMADRDDVKQIIDDKEFMDALRQKMSLAEFIQHPQFLSLINNPDLCQQLKDLDLKDLREYLEKGKSTKYESLAIVGYWDLDVDESLITIKKMNADITSKQLKELKQTLASMSAGSFIKANLNNQLRLTLKGRVVEFHNANMSQSTLTMGMSAPRPAQRNTRGLGVAPSALAPAVRQRFSRAPSSMPPDVAARYGIVGGGIDQMGQQDPMQMMPQPNMDGSPQTGEAPQVTVESKSYEGQWEGDGDTYTITIRGENGQEEKSTIIIQAEQFTINFAGKPLVFLKRI